MTNLETLLRGDDLRSVGNCDIVISKIKNQNAFDVLFEFMFHPDRIVVMHAADAIEKITADFPQYFLKHKKELFELFTIAKNKELNWHIALLIPRLDLETKEFMRLWKSLSEWAKDTTNSKLVRVASIQRLFEMAGKKTNLLNDFYLLTLDLEKENIPSMNARIRNIRKEMSR